MSKRIEIRNSTAEFLIFQIEGKEQGVEVYYKDKTVWCTQKAMGTLFDCTSDNISVHLQNIYDTDELKKEATTEKISVVRREGNREVNRTLQFYNLDAIISVGYRMTRGQVPVTRRDYARSSEFETFYYCKKETIQFLKKSNYESVPTDSESEGFGL